MISFNENVQGNLNNVDINKDTVFRRKANKMTADCLS